MNWVSREEIFGMYGKMARLGNGGQIGIFQRDAGGEKTSEGSVERVIGRWGDFGALILTHLN